MDAIERLLTRGVDKIYPSREALEKVLRSGKKLRLYQGFDPSGAHLHIGHVVGLRKLRQFQELGHAVIFLIGDFTGMIGDPSGKSEARKPLTKEEVLHNAQDYKDQAQKILQFDGENPVQIKFNSEWNSKLTFEDVLRLSSHFTVQQMIERDMFQARIKQNKEISLVEFLYPIMVAYDAVAMNVDMELGGSDQTFNMLAGRKLHKHTLQKEKFVMTVPLLSDATGRKIGKTEGNAIGLTDPPNEFFGKIMALGDDAILNCFLLLTNLDVEPIRKRLESGENPMMLKKQLAFELTKQFNSEKDAVAAQQVFEQVHQQGDTSGASAIEVKATRLFEALVQTSISKSEVKRLIEQEAVDINNQTVNNDTDVHPGDMIRVGKKKFIKVV